MKGERSPVYSHTVQVLRRVHVDTQREPDGTWIAVVVGSHWPPGLGVGAGLTQAEAIADLLLQRGLVRAVKDPR